MQTIIKCPVQPSPVARADGLLAGVIAVPRGATILHIGSEPPEGGIFLWVSVPIVPSKDTPADRIDVIIAKPGDNVPDDYVYRGAIWSAPVLLVFQKVEAEPKSALILPRGGMA